MLDFLLRRCKGGRMAHQATGADARGAGEGMPPGVPSSARPLPAPHLSVQDPVEALLDLQRGLLAIVGQIDGVLSELTGGEL